MNADAYNCIARHMKVLSSYPEWEELVNGAETSFAVPLFGGWLAPLRHALIEAKIPDGDAIYTQILKAFEYLTDRDPHILWSSADAVEKTDLQFQHVEKGWFDLNLKRCRTRLQTRHVRTAQNCEARVKELAHVAKCQRRTRHVVSRSHLFTFAALPAAVKLEREGFEERGGVKKKKRTYRNVISKTLREELDLSFCLVSEQMEKEGAEVDWISVLNVCEKPYNANGPKQYGSYNKPPIFLSTSLMSLLGVVSRMSYIPCFLTYAGRELLSYLDSCSERLRTESETGRNEEVQTSKIIPSNGSTSSNSCEKVANHDVPALKSVGADEAHEQGSTLDGQEANTRLHRRKRSLDCKAAYSLRKRTATVSCYTEEVASCSTVEGKKQIRKSGTRSKVSRKATKEKDSQSQRTVLVN